MSLYDKGLESTFTGYFFSRSVASLCSISVFDGWILLDCCFSGSSSDSAADCSFSVSSSDCTAAGMSADCSFSGSSSDSTAVLSSLFSLSESHLKKTWLWASYTDKRP